MSSSIIPKISLGLNKKRSSINLSQDTSTTANFGFCQPTFCREMIPNSTFKLNTESFVRLAPVTVPTFGRINYRTYHAFVPYSSLYFPFDSFLAGLAYTNTSGSTFQVNRVPTFTFADLTQRWLQQSDLFEVYTSDNQSTYASRKSTYKYSVSDYIMHYGADLSSMSYDFTITSSNASYPTLYVKYTFAFQRLFKIFVGLGYNYNPESTVPMNVLKLLAYYKVWFNYFAVQRDKNYFHTNAYKLTVALSNSNGSDYSNWSDINKALFSQFINDLDKCFYCLPADYFSMSILTGNVINSNTSLVSIYDATLEDQISASVDSNYSHTYDTDVPLAQKMAFALMRFANKNTVFGRNIREYLQNTFGVSDEHDNIHEEVVKIGSDSVSIQISDVMSNSDTYNSETGSGSAIGEYAGKGIGYGKGKTYSYTAKQFGCWISISCIVPEGGYVQGTLKENISTDRFDFATPEFDSIGYQLINKCELGNDNAVVQQNTPDLSLGWGLVPRYSHYKVGRNILNGDLMRHSTKDTYNNYTLDRLFFLNGGSFIPGNNEILRYLGLEPSFGNYDRIFDDTSWKDDHFIIHMIYNVDALLPLKSLKHSFDTFDEENDNASMEVNHK